MKILRINTILPGLLMFALSALSPASVMGQCAVPTFRSGLNVDVGPLPADVASGDLNADGRTDAVITHPNTDEVFVFLGNSNGVPTTIKLTSVDAPEAAGIGDFNGDGKMDLAISHGRFSTPGVSILLGDGSGGFGPPADFPTFNVKPLVVADFNNDTNPDVFLGQSNGGASQLLLGNGTGGLSGGSTFSVANTGAVAGDYNNDGKLDLALVSDGFTGVSVVLGDGAGNFGAPTSFPDNNARFIATGDFNSDNKLDVVTAGHSAPTPEGISVMLGDGAGNFGAPTDIDVGFLTITVAVADFNGDSKPDIAVTGGPFMAFLINNGSGGFGAPTQVRTSTQPLDIAVGDFDGDSKADLATINSSGSNATGSFLFGDGAGKLRFPSLFPVDFGPFAIASGDLNNDGHDDLVYASLSNTNVSVLINNGSGGFGIPSNIAVGTQPRAVALRDFTEDGQLDLVITHLNGSVSLLAGDGGGQFSVPIPFNVPGSTPRFTAIGDLNNDGKLDLAVGYLNSNFVSILLADSQISFGPPTQFPVPAGAQDIAINDLNRDGLPDLVIANISGVSILLGNSSTGFGPTTTLPTTFSNAAVVVDDFNGDGKADIASLVPNNQIVNVYLGDGLGGFGQPTPFPAGFAPSFLRSADFNGDGNADLAVSSSFSTVSILTGNGSGVFADPITYHGGTGVPTDEFTIGDFNSDNHPDIALADRSGSVAVIFNSCSATPVSPPALTVSNASVTEGNSGTVDVTFNVNLSAASSKTVVVPFYTAGRDAAKDVDFQARVGVLTFAPGVTAQTITVQVTGDTLDEFDEQFDLVLVYPLNAIVSGAPGRGTIIDDDLPPSLSINDVTVNEGHVGTTPAVFTLSLSAPSGKPVIVFIETADGSAKAGIDYQARSLGLGITPGQTSITFNVPVIGDNLNEPNRNFFVNIIDAEHVTIADGQGVGTIVDDDSLHLILDESGPAADQATALESMLLVRDPFHRESIANWLNLGADRRTRVIVFASNLELFPGQPPSIVVVNLVDGNNQTHDVPAEDVRVVPNFPFTQVVFPLPANLAAGVCKVTLKAHGQTSNTGTIRIAP